MVRPHWRNPTGEPSDPTGEIMAVYAAFGHCF
jgi:hypothetical protein